MIFSTRGGRPCSPPISNRRTGSTRSPPPRRAALGLPAPRIAVGEAADFLLIDATGPDDLVSRAGLRPQVWRAGKPIDAAAPLRELA